MKYALSNSLLGLLLLLGSSCQKPQATYNEGINIIPKPSTINVVEGEHFTLDKKTTFFANSEETETIADFFMSKIQLSTGYELTLEEDALDANIILAINQTLDLKADGYTLDVTPTKITVTGRDATGLFYGMQTLMQLLPAEIESTTIVKDVNWSIPCVNITDEPRFEYRGIMLDVSRHFMPVDFVKKQIDILSLFKINNLHLHLTDDQGWRIEIKKYPLLTEIGAKRTDKQGVEYGDYYTQEQIKDIVAYAADRHITIIPELELPGHELAAIAAYPELSCRNSKTSPRIVWGVEDIVMCPGKESTFEFLEDVIAEMAPLFPGEYFHIGGDECPKTSWKSCPLCQARVKKEGLVKTKKFSAEEMLQSYVIRRIEKVLKQHNKKLIGWDEILEGGLSPEATVMSWRGESGGIAAANMGHSVIMTPNSGALYIDHYQGDSKIEPVSIGGYAPLSKLYNYNPIPTTLEESGKAHYIKGVQANLWSEYMYNTDIMEYRLYPRALAVAEIGWTALDKKDFNDFSRRINNAYVRLDSYDINYHIPQPEQVNGSSNHVAFIDSVSLNFKTTRPIKMEYSIDGGEIKEYVEPIKIDKSSTLAIYSILPSGKKSPTRIITVEKQNYHPAVTIEGAKKGLSMQIIDGEFFSTTELANASIESAPDKIMSKWRDLIINSSQVVDEIEMYAAIADGYIDIPEDGVYFFSSDNDQVWIDGKLLIDNNDEIKRFSRNDKSVALKKGLHPIKTIFLSNIIGGWPSIWGNGAVEIRKSDKMKFEPITTNMLFH